MRKILIAIPALLLLLIGGTYGLRQLQGWNDGMVTARSEIHAAELNGRVYIAGGIGLFRVLDSCEVFDRAAKSWDSCGRLPYALHHVAMAADDARVYASGGYVALPFKQDEDAQLFVLDPDSNDWTSLTPLPHPIGQHAMVHHAGMLYLIGGQQGSTDLATLWAYDLASGEWSERKPMPTARHSHAIAQTADKLYVTGGRSAALGTEIDIIEVYDFASDSWSSLPPMPVGRGGHGAAVMDGRLHVFGGESLTGRRLLADHHILDLETLNWTAGPELVEPRHGFAIAPPDEADEVLIIGGGAKPGMQTIYSVTGTVQPLGK